MIGRLFAALLFFALGTTSCDAALIGRGGSEVTGGGSSDALQTQLASMAVHSWAAIPSSTFHAAEYAIDTTCQFYRLKPSCDYTSGIAADIAGTGGADAIFKAWGNAVWDYDDRCLVIFGGDHQDYQGNEIYWLCGSNEKWVRLSTPDDSNCSNTSTNQYANGDPYDVHTYEITYYFSHAVYQTWRGAYGAQLGGGTAGWCFSGTNVFHVDGFSLTSFSWTANVNSNPGYTINADAIAALDGGTLFFLDSAASGSGFRTLWKTTTPGGSAAWTNTGGVKAADYHNTGDVEPGVALFTLGSTDGFVEYPESGSTPTTISTSGDSTCITNAQNYAGPNGQSAPGFSWYSTDSKFVSPMPGSLNVCELTPAGVWSQVTMTGSTPPTEPTNSNGIFGRFRVVVNYNGSGIDFAIFAPDPNSNVYIARLK